MNSKDNIRELLDKYYQGCTSENEEKQLRQLLADSKNAPEFDAERRFFASLDSPDKAPQWLRLKIEQKIDSTPVKKLKAPKWVFAIKIAATILLLLALAFPLLKPSKPARYEPTPEEVRELTAMALFKLSSTLEKGFNAVETAESAGSESIEKLNKALNSL